MVNKKNEPVTINHFGNALKAISESEDELRVGNYIVLFGGRDLEGLGSANVNADGSRGEFFSPGVDLESSYTKTGHLLVDWEHGTDPDRFGDTDEDNVLGYVDWKTARKDEAGWYVERVLNRRSAYMKWLEELIRKGLVGNSTAAVSRAVKKNSDGEITRWPLRRDTLTVQPMEPRMMDGNVLAAVKALGLEAYLASQKELIPSEAGRPDQGSADPTFRKERQAMDKDDVKALLQENNATLVATLEQQAATAAEEAAKKAVEDALRALPEIQKGIAVLKDPADAPFGSIGEQMRAVKAYETSHGQMEAPRLRYLKTLAFSQKAAQGMSEGVPSDGGFLLDPTLSDVFLRPIYEVGPFSSRVTRLPVGANSNYGWINGIDSTSSADGARWGGVSAAWRAEASTVAASHPKFRRINWELKAVDCKIFVTDEELQDVAQVDAIVREAAADVLSFKVNDAIYRGNGVGKPLGILASGALISAPRETPNQVNWADLITMWSRLHPANRANAIWVYNSEVEPELDRLAAVSHTGTTEMPPRFVDYDAAGVLRIKGRPALASEFCSALGTAGDILVADLAEYLFWEKQAGIQASQNPWLYWDTGEQAFKFTYRCDGQTAHYSPITPANGTAAQSAFVTLSASTS